MKLIALRTFSYGFFLYTTNDIVFLPDDKVKEFIDMGFVKPYEDGFKTMVTKEDPVAQAMPPPPKPTRKKK